MDIAEAVYLISQLQILHNRTETFTFMNAAENVDPSVNEENHKVIVSLTGTRRGHVGENLTTSHH